MTNLDILNDDVVELDVDGKVSAIKKVKWGEIDGTLSNQKDLQTALNSKADNNDLENHVQDTNNPHKTNWNNLESKPFNSIDNNTLKIENSAIKVNTTDNAEEDNTRPITSSGVNTIVGNINVLLEQI